MDTRESPRRTRLLASAMLVLTFVAGGLAGTAVNRVLGAREPASQEASRPDNERRPIRLGRRPPSIFLDTTVFGRIGATAEQRQAIEAVLARRDRELSALFEEMKPRANSVMVETRAEIRAQLSTDQLTRLDKIIQDRNAERQRRERSRDSTHKSKSDSSKRP